ncbi:MAG: hypothetical protein K2X77_30400 [Candidatus Obscuribacterales bacterium]|nr:hypothetical protein [Candidatus Obscuribacterales bacterium]
MTTADIDHPSETFDRLGRKIDPTDSSVAARYVLNDIYCSAWLSHAISALCEHRVPDFVGGEPTAIESIAKKAGLHAPTLYRALRALAANGIFEERGDGFFLHNDVSRLLCADHPYSWSGMARMWGHPSCMSAWMHYRKSLTDGQSGIKHAFGKTLYEHLAQDPATTKAFSDAMISNSAHAAVSISREFPFRNFKRVLDLGGGAGTLLHTILAENEHLEGVIFDLPELESLAKDSIRTADLASRCQFIAGNFLSEVPSGADLYLIKNSLWNWSDDHCIEILRNIRRAIGTTYGARFLLIEYVINSRNKKWTTAYDLQILNMPGGRARTEAEYKMLLLQAGLAVTETDIIEDQTLMLSAPVQ